MPKIKLSKKTVDALPIIVKPTYFFDTALPGFFLRAMPSGAKSWGVEYRAGSGRSSPKRRYTIGSASKLTAEQARTTAKGILASIALGSDPTREKQKKAREITLEGLVELWGKETPLSKRTGRPITERVKDFTLGRLRAHAVPLLGSRKVSEITPRDITKLIASVSAGATALDKPSEKKRGRIKISGGKGAARKVACDLSMIMRFAIERELIDINPVILVTKPKAGKRNDYLRIEDIAKIGAALQELEKACVSPMGIAIIRLLLLTGCRPAEVEGLKWSEIDFRSKCLRMEETKTGYSVRPLSDAALSILEDQEKGSSEFVFPSFGRSGHYCSSSNVWNQAREIAELPDKVRYHARHAVATLALSAGHDVASVAAIMGHKSPRTTLATYTHVVDEQ